MVPFHFILIHISLFLGVFLIVIGWAGTLSGTAFIHRSPFGLHRPLVYALALSLVFFQRLELSLGIGGSRLVFYVLTAALLYETCRLMLVPYVAVTGASAELLDADIRDAFTKLNLQYQGHYPRYATKNPKAEFKVRFWKMLGQGDISVSPCSQRPLLRKIEAVIDKDFSAEEQLRANRGFFMDILEGVVLCGLAIWQLMKYA